MSSLPHTEVVDAVPVTNPAYFTCLVRTGERHKLFAASSDPSPDAGYQRYVGAIRAAGHYVLYVSVFIQDNPDGPTTDSAGFHVVDVADHDRQTLAVPDPNIGLIGLGEAAVSVDRYMAWTQVNPENSGTTLAVERQLVEGALDWIPEALDADHAVVEVDVEPLEPSQLTASETTEQGHAPERLLSIGQGGEELAELSKPRARVLELVAVSGKAARAAAAVRYSRQA